MFVSCLKVMVVDPQTKKKKNSLKSDLLNNLLPGDMVLADRDFNIASELHSHRITVIVPAFTKGITCCRSHTK